MTALPVKVFPPMARTLAALADRGAAETTDEVPVVPKSIGTLAGVLKGVPFASHGNP